MQLKVKHGEVAIDLDYFWQPISSCPVGVKVQLLGIGGIAIYGKYDGKDDFWTDWCPVPKRRKLPHIKPEQS